MQRVHSNPQPTSVSAIACNVNTEERTFTGLLAFYMVALVLVLAVPLNLSKYICRNVIKVLKDAMA
jgi:hypothetical protein